MSPARILHLGKYYPPAPGGIESHVQTLARGQSDLGCEVSVLCVNHADKYGEDVTHKRTRRTSSIREMDGKVDVQRVGRLFGLNRLEVCPSLLGKIRKETSRVDVVHLHTPNPLMLAAWWLAGNRRPPLVVTHHSDVIKQKLLRHLVSPLETRVYREARMILSDSPTYGEGSELLKTHSEKVKVLPLGINLSPLMQPGPSVMAGAESLKKQLGWPIWLMVGRLTYYKGYHVAIEALSKVAGTLVIVGGGPLENQLRDQAVKAGVQDRIIWKKQLPLDELASHYHAATALWFPSVARSEGFGLAQVEAMACGCPVINTAIPASGVSWVSQDGVSGLTIGIEDPNSLAMASQRLLDDPALCQKLSAGAKDRASNYFDAAQMARSSLELYQLR